METCWTASQAYEHLSPRERRDRKRADSAYFRLIGGQVTKGSDHHEALKEALYYYLKIVEPDTFLELEAYPESRYFAPLGSGPPEENYSLWQYCPDVQMVGRLGKQLRGRKDRFTKRPNIWLEIEMHPHRVCEKLGWLVVFAQSDEFVPPDMIVFGVPTRPVAVSALREKSRTPYPVWAVRELLMNAVMHRDYESNSPVRFYWFSDRIEIQNPGGLYGEATPENFPNQNAYRNPKIAEALKVLGYVNRFGRGIARVQAGLQENGNPPATFDISQPTFFLATVHEA